MWPVAAADDDAMDQAHHGPVCVLQMWILMTNALDPSHRLRLHRAHRLESLFNGVSSPSVTARAWPALSRAMRRPLQGIGVTRSS
jgi:hypothetical protein